MTCYLLSLKDGKNGIVCGDLGPACIECGAVAEYLCDYPVGEGKTCDRPLCDAHAERIAPDIHYCPSHSKLWLEFRQSGGVEKELENVIPFKTPPEQTP